MLMRDVRIRTYRRRAVADDPQPTNSRTRRANEWYRQKRLQLIREYGGACSVCGALEDLEFAHTFHTGLEGQGRGRNARIRDIIQHPEAYRLLCKECHVRLDRTGGSM
jgi:hypothetical protein